MLLVQSTKTLVSTIRCHSYHNYVHGMQETHRWRQGRLIYMIKVDQPTPTVLQVSLMSKQLHIAAEGKWTVDCYKIWFVLLLGLSA